MANPILNDKTMKEASEAGYASGSWGPPQGPPGYAMNTNISGISDGPISAWDSQRMTVQGTATATKPTTAAKNLNKNDRREAAA